MLSIGRLLDQNALYAKFDQDHCFFQDLSNDAVKALGKRHHGLYKFMKEVPSSINFVSSTGLSTSTSLPSFDLFHARCGHLSLGKIKHILVHHVDANKINDFHYEACVLGKYHKLPFPISTSIASICFELIHIDL